MAFTVCYLVLFKVIGFLRSDKALTGYSLVKRAKNRRESQRIPRNVPNVACQFEKKRSLITTF